MKFKIFLETFGCSFNQASSEIIEGLLLKSNYQFVSSIDETDIIILNTCIVKTNTQARIFGKIKTYSRKYPNTPILIAGCMPEVLSEQVQRINPQVSMIGPHFVTDVEKAVQSMLQRKPYIRLGKRKESKLCLPRKTSNPLIAKVQIAQGCLNNCSYCITKFAMGDLESYPIDQILHEIKLSLKKGCKEIWLTAQDSGCYGFDSNSSLPELLRKIIQLDSEFKIRVGMMNPNSFIKIFHELVQILSTSKIYDFLHIPIQSGNDEILRIMHRKYTVLEVQPLLNELKTTIPDLALSIDVIVGFPSETEHQFEDTISFVKSIKPDIVNISKFGARPKTLAATLKPISTKIVKRRSSILSEICNEIAQSQNNTYIRNNRTQNVLTVSAGKKGGVIARTNNYKPVILEENCELGKFYEVQLISAEKNYLRGVLI